MKLKIKPYNGKINTNFHNEKLPKEGSQFICLSVILIDSIFRTGNGNFNYPQFFLKEYNHIIKERKNHNYTADDIEISSVSDEEILDKIQTKKNSESEKSNEEEDSDEKK